MSLSRITSRYAKSLIELAKEQGSLNSVLEDIRGFIILAEQRDFLNMIKSPIINKDKKRKIFKAIFDGKVDKLTLMFFDIIINKSRESILPEIAKAFIEEYNASKNITFVDLTTAIDIDEKVIASIRKSLNESQGEGGEMEMVAHTDPQILGGYVLKFDDKVYNASLKYKLDVLKKEILKG